MILWIQRTRSLKADGKRPQWDRLQNPWRLASLAMGNLCLPGLMQVTLPQQLEHSCLSLSCQRWPLEETCQVRGPETESAAPHGAPLVGAVLWLELVCYYGYYGGFGISAVMQKPDPVVRLASA